MQRRRKDGEINIGAVEIKRDDTEEVKNRVGVNKDAG